MKNGAAVYIMQDDKSRVIPVSRCLKAELYRKKTIDQNDFARAALENIIIENSHLDDEDVHESQQIETAAENVIGQEKLQSRMVLATKRSNDAVSCSLKTLTLKNSEKVIQIKYVRSVSILTHGTKRKSYRKPL